MIKENYQIKKKNDLNVVCYNVRAIQFMYTLQRYKCSQTFTIIVNNNSINY
jgi:hypothetical protein